MGYLFSHFLIALLSGFVVLVTFPWSKYYFQRQTGYHLLLWATLVGLLLIMAGDAVSRFTHFALEDLRIHGHQVFVSDVRAGWLYFANPIMTYSSDGEVPVKHYGPLVAFLLSLVLWALAKLLTMSDKIKRHALKFVIQRARDPLEMLLYEAQRYQRFIMITMKSRKIYAGWVETGIDPMREKKAIKILPAWSGCRKGDDLSAELITDYSPLIYAIKRWSRTTNEAKELVDSVTVVDHLSGQTMELKRKDLDYLEKNFGVVVPVDEIESVTAWHPVVHEYVTKLPKRKTTSTNKKKKVKLKKVA